METASDQAYQANLALKEWDVFASHTRKLIECSFGSLKRKFLVLKSGMRMSGEDDIPYFVLPRVILHNLGIESKKIDNYNVEEDGDGKTLNDEVIGETETGHRQRDTEFQYCLREQRS